MFHVVGLNAAVALLLAHVFMLVTESNAVREDRDLCCLVGCLMSFFYTAATSLMAMDTFALFRFVNKPLICSMQVPEFENSLSQNLMTASSSWYRQSLSDHFELPIRIMCILGMVGQFSYLSLGLKIASNDVADCHYSSPGPSSLA